MSETENKSLQPREKTEVATPTEQTRPGPVFVPAVDILEADQELIVLADLPGVKNEDLSVDLHQGTLTISGDVSPPEGPNERDVIREFQTGQYYRQFTLSEMIDQSRIEADLKDGVLRLTLPKTEEAQPRRITVKGS
jgi:HSP20 family molecular chaperone IbpA